MSDFDTVNAKVFSAALDVALGGGDRPAAPQTTLQKYIAAVREKRDLSAKLEEAAQRVAALESELVTEYIDESVTSKTCDGARVTLGVQTFASVRRDFDVSPAGKLQMLADYVAAGGSRDDALGVELRNAGATRESIIRAAFDVAEMNDLPELTVNSQRLSSVLREGVAKPDDRAKLARAASVVASDEGDGCVSAAVDTVPVALRGIVTLYDKIKFSVTSR